MTDSYPKEQLDLMLRALETKVDTNQREIMLELKQHRMTHDELLAQVKFTNGKVKKLTMALIAVAAFALGSGGESIVSFFKFLV